MQALLFPDNLTFWYETYRALGNIAYGGADIGEALAAAERIEAGDYESWHTEWSALADSVEKQGRAQLAAGHPVSGRDSLFRAASYWRSAEFFLRDERDDPRVATTYERGVACFGDGVAQWPFGEPFTVPFEGATLTGWFLRGQGDGPRPTLAWHNGFDGWAEELVPAGGLGGVERGWNVVLFDGPGQPGPRIRDGLTFRPDWEKPVGAVLDALLARPDVDPDRIALAGNSMGGQLAPRAAAFDPRIAAVLCIDGVYDAGAAFVQMGDVDPADADRLTAGSDDALDQHLRHRMAHNQQFRWAARQGMWAFGQPTPRRFLAATLPYHLRDGIAERITCPVFVGRAQSEQFFVGQPEQLIAHLTAGRPELVDFTDAEGAGAHGQVGAARLLAARMFDWLDDTLGTG